DASPTASALRARGFIVSEIPPENPEAFRTDWGYDLVVHMGPGGATVGPDGPSLSGSEATPEAIADRVAEKVAPPPAGHPANRKDTP
ncbi:MAG: hypothetical protein KDJ28_19100, partial [Candidatus Competibacteraceae bacterium]|nr:hypothetical protein [Candidatus Competibacteraceae bacterium]